ncbi:MAG TPA: histidine kinase [Longimicrobium sp.]|jgi:signal transduction histidine kinase
MDPALRPVLPAEAAAAPAAAPSHSAVREWLAVAAVWTLVGILAACQTGLAHVYAGEPVQWGRLIVSYLADWYTCALFTPVIVWMVRRWPPERLGWWRSVAAYAPSLAAMVVLKYVVYLPLRGAITAGPVPTLAQQLAGGFFFEYIALASVLGMALALHYYRSVRARERQAAELEALLARAQLHALAGQLRPHFLFNALHGVSTLMHRDVDAADEMLSELSALLRSTLERDGVHEVPLHEEMATVRHYVQIMRVRFGDRLTVAEEIDPSARDALVPPLMLQPLVENAVEHGIARDRGAGHIWIRARADGDGCTITVADDGPGLLGGSDAAVREGVGLSNTRRRLRQLYGDAATLTLQTVGGRGTDVTLRLPFRTTAGQPG